MTDAPCDILDRCIEFDPSGDFEAFLKLVPGKWVVYLMADAQDRPVQLLCVKNLRASLKRRLGTGDELPARSKRVDYRELIRRIRWCRVDSALEADVVFLEAAWRLFPHSYRGMYGSRPAWFVHVNPSTTYPRYTKTNEPTGSSGIYLGPIEDRNSAQKLVHLVESLFDLCRDYSILTQSPNAGSCPWKQMNKCVGPCDGSIDLDAYRQLIAFSAQVLADPEDYIRQQTTRMKQAAAELKFELAEKIKAYVDQLLQLGKGPFRHVRRLEDSQYVTLQRGPRAGTAKVFLITPGRIEQVAGLISEPASTGELLHHVFSNAQDRDGQPLDQYGVERIGVVTHHLFAARAKQNMFIPVDALDETSLLRAYRDLRKQNDEADDGGEGVVKEMNAPAGPSPA